MRKGKQANQLVLIVIVSLMLFTNHVDASNGNSVTYYGVENDPTHSSSANETAKAAETLGNAGEMKLPVKQMRSGQQILADLDQLVADHGEGGKLKPGLFVFHYSGHGAAQAGGPGYIGLPGGVISTDQLVDKLLQITGENTTVLIMVDSCGAGNLKNSLESKVKDEDGKRLNYYAVMGTDVMKTGDQICPRQGSDSIGAQVTAGLKKGADGNFIADTNKDGRLSVKELGDYVKDNGDGFSGVWASFDYEGEPAHLDTSMNNTALVNSVTVSPKPIKEDKAPPARSSSTDSIAFDALDQYVSFTDHVISDTSYSNDPMLQARIKIPSMNLLGQISPTEYLFEAGDPLLSVFGDNTEYFAGSLPQLIYDVNTNEFVGRIDDLKFSNPNSDWVHNTGMLFDPLSANFDPRIESFFSYRPDQNWLASTGGLATTSNVAGGDGIRITYAVPEPATWILFASSFPLLLLARIRRKRL